MLLSGKGKLFENNFLRYCFGPMAIPYDNTGARDETLACRTTAALGIALNISPVYDVTGPDAIKFFNQTCTNRDFARTNVGGSKHVLICNDEGYMLADGVAMRIEENRWRTYWLAPVLEYYLETSGLDVKGTWVFDEFFIQIDGPKSLEIIEDAAQADAHDIKFARNKKMTIADKPVRVHRLGMSGALAYEIHGNQDDAEAVCDALCISLEKFGGRKQGFRNYINLNHTPGGYPNQGVHYLYPCYTSGEGLKNWVLMDHITKMGLTPWAALLGSASDKSENAFMTPYDVGWGNLVNFNHDFPGKEALARIKTEDKYTMVTLEWNADDVGDVYADQFRGKDKFYEPIEYCNGASDVTQIGRVRVDYTYKDGKVIGISSGNTYAFFENRRISLCKIEKQYANVGEEVIVLWGTPRYPQKEIRATVAPFPYYNGKYRNETFDVEEIPRRF